MSDINTFVELTIKNEEEKSALRKVHADFLKACDQYRAALLSKIASDDEILSSDVFSKAARRSATLSRMNSEAELKYLNFGCSPHLLW